MRFGATILLASVAVALAVPASGAPAGKAFPYFASLRGAKARMRTGPGKSYPISWIYQRADLPVKVLDTYEHGTWLRVEDPGGTQGWMLASLIGEARTGFVMGAEVELRDSPRVAGKLVWRAAPGVVGRLSKCAENWCFLDVHGRGGFVEANRIWGVNPDETLN